jgi:hypothetical protein
MPFCILWTTLPVIMAACFAIQALAESCPAERRKLVHFCTGYLQALKSTSKILYKIIVSKQYKEDGANRTSL